MAGPESSVQFPISSLTSTTLPPPRTRIFKIIVIGDSGVGKTCLTYRFCAGKFPEKTEATIGVDFRERLVDIDGEKIKVWVVVVVNTAGLYPRNPPFATSTICHSNCEHTPGSLIF